MRAPSCRIPVSSRRTPRWRCAGYRQLDHLQPGLHDGDLHRSGTQCLKTFGPFVQGGGSGGTQALPAAPGETWVGEIYALNSSTDPIDNVDFGVYKIEFRDASGQLAAGGLFGVDIFESNPINATTPQDTWTLLGVGTRRLRPERLSPRPSSSRSTWTARRAVRSSGMTPGYRDS